MGPHFKSSMVLMIWHFVHLLLRMLPGCTIGYIGEQRDLLWLDYSQRLVLIIEIFSELMYVDILLLFWALGFKMVRKFQNGIDVLGWVSSMVSKMNTPPCNYRKFKDCLC